MCNRICSDVQASRADGLKPIRSAATHRGAAGDVQASRADGLKPDLIKTALQHFRDVQASRADGLKPVNKYVVFPAN